MRDLLKKVHFEEGAFWKETFWRRYILKTDVLKKVHFEKRRFDEGSFGKDTFFKEGAFQWKTF